MTEDPAPPGRLAFSPDPCGWLSDLPAFCGAQPRVVRLKLQQFVRDAGAEQLRAWDESIPWLQRECKEAVDAYDAARTWSTAHLPSHNYALTGHCDFTYKGCRYPQEVMMEAQGQLEKHRTE